MGFPTAFGFVPWGHYIANVNAIDELVKTPEENPTIGLLICKDKDQTEVQWAFRRISTPMGVAAYGNVGIEDIQRHLQTDG